MSKNHFFYKAFLCLFVTLTFLSCSDDNNDETSYGTWTPPTSWTQGALILNSGNQDANNSLLSYYDKSTNKCNPTVFESANKGLHLGDTGQDLLVADDYIYISVYGSGVIYILDNKARIVNTIESKKGGVSQKPRYFAQDANYVYVTYYDGYLARINKTTHELDATQVKVGNYPEGVTVANGNIYVANSGGLNYPNYDKTVSVVNASTFTKTRDVEVIINPTKVAADNLGNVYVVSMGNYKTGKPEFIPNTLQRINTNFTVDSLGTASLIAMNPTQTKIYTMYAQYGSPTIESRVYDAAKKEYETASFIEETDFVASPSTLDIDPSNNDIYIGTSDYRTNATMYKFGSNGKLITTFNTQGLNPMGIFFLTK